jgi:hypothetical protein
MGNNLIIIQFLINKNFIFYKENNSIFHLK